MFKERQISTNINKQRHIMPLLSKHTLRNLRNEKSVILYSVRYLTVAVKAPYGQL